MAAASRVVALKELDAAVEEVGQVPVSYAPQALVSQRQLADGGWTPL
jgi:hypothetical protein